MPLGTQAFFALAAFDAELAREAAVRRLAAVWTLAAAIHVMDDIADGDCDYLPAEAASGTVVGLHALGVRLAIEGGVTPNGLLLVTESLIRLAAGQNVEVRTKTWSLERYLSVADQIGGHQYRSYLGVLWDGTPLGQHTPEISTAIGRAGMVAHDIATGDRRFFSLPAHDRAPLVAAARAALEALETRRLRSVEFLAKYADESLDLSV